MRRWRVRRRCYRATGMNMSCSAGAGCSDRCGAGSSQACSCHRLWMARCAATIARWLGFAVIRGSSTRTGARALRDYYELLVKQGVSPVITPRWAYGSAP